MKQSGSVKKALTGKHVRSVLVPVVLSIAVLALVMFPLEGCRTTRRAFYNLTHHRKATSKPNTTDYADNVEDVVNSPRLAILKWANYSDYQQQVQTFYDDRNYELAWTRDGKPTAATMALIGIFEHADLKGLRPEDYDASRWPERLQRVQTILKTHDTSDNAQDQIAQFDAAVTITAMRLVSDLHVGRINPQTLNFDIDTPAKRAAFDLPTFLNDRVVDNVDAASVVATVEPQNPLYLATEAALPRYLALAQQQSGQPQQPLPPVTKTLRPGERYAALPQLVADLEATGDAGESGVAGTIYTEKIAAAVKQYQRRHGLTADGRLSNQTLGELNVPWSERVQQIDLSLERWRWLPEKFIQPRVLVNLPEFMVRTYGADGTLQFKMKNIDGEADGQHDTPMFVRTMRYLIFRPYWNLPADIVKKDLLKHVQSSGDDYLTRNNYQVTTHAGKPVTDWTVADLADSKYAVRQMPGPKNSLGLVKFMFPNEYDVYMHSTPEMNLFNLTRRDKSHGCIRLNDAEAMADWVLQGQGDWDATKIHAAMFGDDDNRTVSLKTPLTVDVTYLTAVADEDGTMHFFDDLYGYDQQLEDALAQPRPYDQSEHKINPKLTPGETE